MKKLKYSNFTAFKEHLLNGNRISELEGILLFGVRSFHASITRLRNDGFLIKNNQITFTKVLNRLNKYTVCKAPHNLPIKEILLTEYWISQ